MYDSTQEPCCYAIVTSGGRDHDYDCPVEHPERFARLLQRWERD